MNMLVSNEFGQYFVRLPLQKAANIVNGNALKFDWETIVSKKQLNYILGNPPFIGSKLMTTEQRVDLTKEFEGTDGAGVLDYVCAWYAKAAKFIQGTTCEVAYVSTNSIVQGEQVGILWSYLILKKRMKINFAHRTFKWTNEAKGKAAVYCVIIGFSLFDRQKKYIYDYSDVNSQAHLTDATKINPYLLDGPNLVIEKRSNPLCAVPDMSFGNMPLDGGNLIVEDEEYLDFLRKEPLAKSYLKPLVSAHEFLNGGKRWCLWLVDVDPVALRKMPMVIHRVEAVRKFRLASKAPSTKKFAQWPSLFRDKNNPESAIVVPRVSSENRRYIPMGFFTKEYIISDTCMYIPNGTLYHFGVLMSDMHMAWVRTVCGRLESRYRYSKDIVYNNFPWPESPSEKQKAQIEQVAQAVLDARAQFPESSLADLYDPLTMPPVLLKAHQELDKAVDLAYRPQPFPSEAKRMEFLFELYEKYTAGLFGGEKKGKKKKSAKA
jgi:hypothetical protein